MFKDAMSLDPEGVKRLYLAVVLQGIADLRKSPGDGKLKAWLLADGLFILESYGQPVILEKWLRLVETGCPEKFSMLPK